MKILDLDMDYFLTMIENFIPDSCTDRLSEEDFGDCVWQKDDVRCFFEENLGLSKDRKILGRIVSGHNEALFFWRELIKKGSLSIPFEVIHVDSHADLGLGYYSVTYILNNLLHHSVPKRPSNNQYIDLNGYARRESIGDYLLFAIAYRWIEKLIYCANPNGHKNDWVYSTIKNFHEELIWDEPKETIIQLVYNSNMKPPNRLDSKEVKKKYLQTGTKEPEVPLLIIPTIEDVKFNGDFDFAVLAQSPNYTPPSADFIMKIFREYIEEC